MCGGFFISQCNVIFLYFTCENRKYPKNCYFLASLCCVNTFSFLTNIIHSSIPEMDAFFICW